MGEVLAQFAGGIQAEITGTRVGFRAIVRLYGEPTRPLHCDIELTTLTAPNRTRSCSTPRTAGAYSSTRRSPAATRFKQYFIDALDLFYTAEELSIVLRELGFVEVTVDTVFHGMIGFHRAVKPEAKG